MATALSYVGDPGRYYPHLVHTDDGPAGLVPVPGESYELDTDPGDGRWTTDPAAARAAAAAHADSRES